MTRILSQVFLLSLMISVAATLGCDAGPDGSDATSADPHADHDHAHDEHAHPTEGPHHGSLVELGDESYHAEIVHDDAAGALTVYLLDSSARQTASSEATEVVINVRRGEQPVQFKLPAKPSQSQSDGKYSEYSLTSKELLESLHDETSTARLSITMEGKPYSGKITHDDHAAHDHAH